jgi:outer membrane biosynthesis protein TonB
MPSAGLRFALEAAFLILVAVGAGLAKLEPVVIVALMAVAWVLVALVERASAKAAAPLTGDEAAEEGSGVSTREQPRHVDVVEVEPAAVPAPEPAAVRQPEPETVVEPELAVSERSARAILASSPPPVSDPPPPEPESEPEPEPEPAPEPEPEPAPEPEPEPAKPDPEPEPVYSGPAREWNIWDLQRLVRDHAGESKQEEQAALILSLRDFARADGTLPLEFDELVRESFGALLSENPTSEPAAAP